MPHSTDPAQHQQHVMTDLWNQMPVDPRALVPAIAHQVAAHAPVALVEERHPAPLMRPVPCRDPRSWAAVKCVAQLALVGSVLLFVVYGDSAPLLAASSIASSMLLVGMFVLVDRQRFAERDPSFTIVEMIEPQVAMVEPVGVHHAPLVPLAEHMATILPERLSVT